ncbi:PH domain-like protein [Fragilariopsis cylindrus CCMP1102]|uniref:PH domain-like protein n=1 Tax=Fragilariopsis cylindrus CCMP1102 TaxID=635003 RepID=A0A1E7ENJ5_9STRA|nr:PH domain-like protein [Fragilariopsis cylindrus CCMP1102]|eukprot:OEU07491.1 PH domain-like protein [Fragilariopsis cylindrus CCMP1102]
MDTRNDANLRLLKRTVNKGITDIIGNYTATHVVLYFFHPTTQQWEKSLIEGSLSLVKVVDADSQITTTAQKYLLIILNRNSPDNYKMEFTKDFQLQQSNPYLILKNYENQSKEATIRGIWFPNENERTKMNDLLMDVLNELKNPTVVVSAAAALPTPTIDRNAATAALFASLNIGGSTSTSSSSSNSNSNSNANQQQQSQQPTLDKKSLQLSLLSLIQDERFLDLIHAQYLKVHNARTKNNNNNNSRK